MKIPHLSLAARSHLVQLIDLVERTTHGNRRKELLRRLQEERAEVEDEIRRVEAAPDPEK